MSAVRAFLTPVPSSRTVGSQDVSALYTSPFTPRQTRRGGRQRTARQWQEVGGSGGDLGHPLLLNREPSRMEDGPNWLRSMLTPTRGSRRSSSIGFELGGGSDASSGGRNRGNSSHQKHGAGDGPDDSDSSSTGPKLQSNWQTGANVVNIFVGLGLLSKPYAFAACGWMGIVGLLVACLLTNYTAKTIVECFSKSTAVLHGKGQGASVSSEHPSLQSSPASTLGLLEGGTAPMPPAPSTPSIGMFADQEKLSSSPAPRPGGHIACSYPDVGKAAFGTPGEWAVIGFVGCEFFGGVAMCLVFIWKNIEDAFHFGDKFTIAVLSSAVVLPTVWVLRFSELSFLGFLGFASSILTTLLVVGVAVKDSDQIHSSDLDVVRSVEDFGLGMGVFFTSLAGQACLPVLYDQMESQSSYNSLINICFMVIFVVYVLMGIAGYARYGRDTHVLVTTDIASSPGGIVNKLESVFVIASCACTVAPLIAILSELAEERLKVAKRTGAPFIIRGIRTFIFLAAFGLAYAAYSFLGNLESLIGGMGSLATSLLLPAIFYLKLFWADLTPSIKALNVGVAVCSVVFSAFVISSNIDKLA